MRGWVEKRGGAYRARILRDDGTKLSKAVPTRAEGKTWVRRTMTDLERGKRATRRSGTRTVHELIEAFIQDSIDVREKTSKRNAGLLRNHIEPAFGDQRVGDVARKQVQALVTSMSRAGYAPDTVRKVLELCQRIFAEAVREGLIAASPCFEIRKPTLLHVERRFLTPTELAKLALEVDELYRALILTAGYSGLRIGELAALRINSVDLRKAAITVRESATETSTGIVNGPVKTRAGFRRVPIPDQLVDELKTHIAQHSDAANGWVFTSPKGRQMRPHNFRADHFHPATERCGLAPLRPHELRHTAASIWIDAGIPHREIMVRMGWTSPSMMMRYGHLFPSSDEAFAQRVGGAFISPEESH